MTQIRVLIKYSKNFTFNLLILSLFFLIFNSTYTLADIQTGLVSHWKFDDSGTTASDSAGANTGTLVGGPTWTTGKIGNALSLDGLDDYVDLANPTSLQITGALTISAWAYRVGSGSIDIILARDGGSNDRGYRLTFETDNTAQFHVAWTSNSSAKVKSTVQPSNQWIHVVGVYNPSVGAYVYINGVLSGSLTGVPSSIRLSTSGPDIGRNANNFGYFSGVIDDVRVYNRVLTLTDIQELYNFGSVAIDTTPPLRSNELPSGTLPAGTTQATLSLTTDESATCKYSTIAGTSYASMTNTFSTTGASSHSTTVTGLSNGNSYNYYVRCQDTSGNANPDDFVISFSVATSSLPTVTITASDATASEPGTDAGQFTISRTGSTTSPLDISYAISGTAGDSADYTSISTSLTIPAGASSATITITPIDDTSNEGSETVILTLASSVSYVIGSPNTATVTINDNDISIVDPRTLGYIVVTDYAGVDSTGVGDSTAGIQQAIEDAWANHKAVFFPSGTYIVSDTLKAYEWGLWNVNTGAVLGPDWSSDKAHILVGSTAGGSRPVIKLKSSSLSLFDTTTTPRPMISFRRFEAVSANGTSEVEPSDPLGIPPNFEDAVGHLFYDEIRGIDFDCSGHAGCIGVTMMGAQASSIKDVKVNAIGAYAGFKTTPGQDGGVANIEVVGGQYGLLLDRTSGKVQSGANIIGARLFDQTVSAIVYDGVVPMALVGFDIQKAAGPVFTMRTTNPTAFGTVSLIDGQIHLTSGGTAIVNAGCKNLYIRNVYVSGTTDIVQSCGQPTVTGGGTWTRIAEYAATNQINPADDPPYEEDDSNFRSYSMIEGVVSRTPIEPVKNIQTNVPIPPSDLIARHLWTKLPSFEDGPYENPLNYGATPSDTLTDFTAGNTGPDDRAAIQVAIDAASVAGHGRVLLPRGVYHIGNTLTLHANTKLFGLGTQVSAIAYHDSWRPTTGEAVMVQTDDDINANTFLGFLTLHARTTGGSASPPYLYDRFDNVVWRAGRNSMIISLGTTRGWHCPNDLIYPHKVLQVTGSGGGRVYFFYGFDRVTGNAAFRNILISGTTEPLSLYSTNTEATKFVSGTISCPSGQGAVTADANIEILNAANVRIYGMKREGNAPSVVVRDSQNVAVYSMGAMRGPTPLGKGGMVQFLGSSNNVLAANINVQLVGNLPNNETTFREALTGFSVVAVTWPDGVSLYKRGEIDDAAMIISPIVTSFDFSLSNSGSKSVTQGSSVTNTITASLISSIIQPVSYTVSGLPAGATSSFSPTSCNPTCSTTLTITTSSTTPAGNYIITVTGTGGSITKTTSFTLTVATTIPQPTVTLLATPSSIIQGESSTLTWTSTNVNSCTASGGWTGAKAISGTEVVAPLANTTYTLSCSGAGGTATQSTKITVIKPEGDINGDKIVDIQDVLIVVKDFRKTSGYDTKVDLNNDGVINLFDIMAVVKHWGKMY